MDPVAVGGLERPSAAKPLSPDVPKAAIARGLGEVGRWGGIGLGLGLAEIESIARAKVDALLVLS